MKVLEHYGDPAAEERFCRESVGVTEIQIPSLYLSGKKAVEFLQRLLASDVGTLQVGQHQPSCLLTGKGKLVAAFQLLRSKEDGFTLIFGDALRDEVFGAFTKYGFLDDIAVEPITTSSWLAAVGPSAASLLGRIEESSDSRRPGQELFQRLVGAFCCPAEVADRMTMHREVEALGGCFFGTAVAELLRIEAGVPRWGIDFDGSNFPNECGWEDALSYTKGCYIGQEVIARMRTYGHLNKKLFRLRIPGAVEAPPGTKLYLGGKEAGWITSSATSFLTGERFALGYLRQHAWEPETVLAVGSAEGPAAARVLPLPERCH